MPALTWLLALLTGRLAIAVATLAVAGIGLAMLTGRVDWRRGGGVVAGCMLIVGAPRIADGLLALAPQTPSPETLPPGPPAAAPPPVPAPATSTAAGDGLASAYTAARQAVAIRFPTAAGVARLSATVAADGHITRLDARGDGLDPAVLETITRIVAASGLRLPPAAASRGGDPGSATADLPPLAIGGAP